MWGCTALEADTRTALLLVSSKNRVSAVRNSFRLWCTCPVLQCAAAALSGSGKFETTSSTSEPGLTLLCAPQLCRQQALLRALA